MKKLGKGIGGALLSLAFVFAITAAAGNTASAQYRNDDRYQRDRWEREREWRRRQNQNNNNDAWRRNRNNGIYNNRGYGNNGYYNQQELQRGYQQGLNTGASDAQRRQSYSPERSHFYRDSGYSQAFRQGFVQGYNQGYRQYAGYGNGRYGNNRGYNNGSLGNILGGIFRP